MVKLAIVVALVLFIITVSTAAPPKEHHYTVSSNAKICIIMDAGIQIFFTYNDTKTSQSHTIDVPSMPEVSTKNSQCGDISNDTYAVIQLSWGENILRFVINATGADDKATISQVSFNTTIDGNPIYAESSSLNFEMSEPEQPFLCNVSLKRSLPNGDVSAEMLLDGLKLQAFGIKNGKYTGEVAKCSQMLSSTASPSTPAKTSMAPSTASPVPKVNVHLDRSVDNSSCFILQGELSFDIRYINSSGIKKTGTVAIPSSADLLGTCVLPNATVQTVELKFYSDWIFYMTFTKFEGDEYGLSDVRLTYQLSYFPDSNQTESITVNSTTDNERFKATVGGYYRCATGIDVELDDVKMHAKEFKVQAFRNDKGQDFVGQYKECAKDAVTDNIVPIAVGAALAALVVIVLIAYIIGRRRNRSGYQSV